MDTEISPELVPRRGEGEGPAQSTEAKIGPYELQDFNLYYITRYGFRPSKVAFLAQHAWGDRAARRAGRSCLPEDARHEYDLATIKKWLEVFLYRFFQISQFKRSAMPNGPKVGSGGSLSPRGDWRAPSDSEAGGVAARSCGRTCPTASQTAFPSPGPLPGGPGSITHTSNTRGGDDAQSPARGR